MKSVTAYVAFDNTLFHTQEECAAYEAKQSERDLYAHIDANCGKVYCDDAGFDIIEPHHVADYIREHWLFLSRYCKP